MRELDPIDDDIRHAATLPGSFYRDADLYRASLRTVFAKGWHLVSEATAPPSRGAHPWTLLPGALDVPLLFTRDEEGSVRCLSNVCTHRGAVMVDEPCTVSSIRCPYHGRRFNLAGRVTHTPEFQNAENFPREVDHLPLLPLREMGPLRFVSLPQAEGVSWETWMGPAAERLPEVVWRGLPEGASEIRHYDLSAHWALYCDNYLEGFHIPFVHPTLSAALDYQSYASEVLPWGVLQIGIAKEDEVAFDLPAGHRDGGQRVGAYYLWLFPNLMLNFYPWGLSVNVVQPRGLDQSQIAYLSYVRDASLRESGAGAGLHAVELEDHGVIGRVQRGIRSPLYDRGRYSPSREQGVHHFHRMLLAVMGAG